jgi:hypothetical protein
LWLWDSFDASFCHFVSLLRLWACSVELTFSALRGTVWFGACFYFTTKMSGFPPSLLNKGEPFGFHNSNHLTSSWNILLGSRAQSLPGLPLSWAMPDSGAMPASLQRRPMPVYCAVVGAVIHCEDNHGPCVCPLGSHFTVH